jgi:uncharacterized protein (DUF433 family)
MTVVGVGCRFRFSGLAWGSTLQNGEVRDFDRITWNPNQMNGQPCIRGTRLTVRRVVEAVALYSNRDDLLRNYPDLEPDDIPASSCVRGRQP